MSLSLQVPVACNFVELLPSHAGKSALIGFLCGVFAKLEDSIGKVTPAAIAAPQTVGAKRDSRGRATSLVANLGTVPGLLHRVKGNGGTLFLSSDELFAGPANCLVQPTGSADKALLCTALSGGLPIRQALVKDGIDIDRCCISGFSGTQVKSSLFVCTSFA